MGRRITLGGVLAAVGGLVLLAAMFFDWFDVQISAGRVPGADAVADQAGGTNAWQAFELIDLVLLLAAALALAHAVGRLTGDLPALPISPGLAVAAAGVVALAFALVGLGDPPVEEGRLAGGFMVDSSPQVGAFVGLAACALIGAGGLLVARE